MGIVLDELGAKVVEVDGLKFTIEQETYLQNAETVEWMQKQGLLDPLAGTLPGHIMAGYKLACRVSAWEGIDLPDGKTAPCDMVTKLHFFGKYPTYINRIYAELNKGKEGELKNLGTSHGGESTTAPTCAGPAETDLAETEQ